MMTQHQMIQLNNKKITQIFLKNLLNQKNQSKNKKTPKIAIILLSEREKVLNERPIILAWAAKVYNYKVSDHKQLKILIPGEILQRLPIALAQVKAGNTSENLLNEIRKIIYSLYQVKEITKKAYNNKIISIKL